MEKKTFLALLYLTVLLPINLEIVQYLFASHAILGFGLLNLAVLFIMTLFSTSPLSYPSPNNKKKNIGLTILALFVAVILFSGVIDKLLVEASGRIHEKLSSSNSIVISPTSGDIRANSNEQSGTLVIPTAADLGISGSTVPTSTGSIVLEGQDENNQTASTATDQTALSTGSTSTSTLPKTTISNPNSTYMTYAQVIPHLVKTYELVDSDAKNPSLTRVSRTNELYPTFATAVSKGMIGKDVKPTTTVSCDTYLVLKGIALGWKVKYTGKPFAAYRAEAEARGKVNGCDAGNYVTSKTL